MRSALRGIAVAHLISGVLGLGLVLSTPMSRTGAELAGALCLLIVGLSAAATFCPDRLEPLLFGHPRELAIGLLVLAVAVNTAFGLSSGPLFGWSLCAIATGAAQLPGRGWLSYGLAAALLAVIGTTLAGHSDGLADDHLAGSVLLGAPVGLINAAYFGTRMNLVIRRLRRLELTARQEGDRPKRLREAIPDLERHGAETLALIDDAERATGMVPQASAKDLLAGIVTSRQTVARVIEGGGVAAGTGLRAMMDLQLSAWSHLWTAREMTYRLTVSAAADEVPVRSLSAIQEALQELLDNVDRHGAPGGLVRVDASVNEDFLVIELRNDLDPSPRQTVREGGGYGTARATAALRRVGGTIRLRREPDGQHSATLRLPLLHPETSASAHHMDLRSTNHAAQVARWLSVAFRAFRWASAIGMLATSALDLPDAEGRTAFPVALVAVAAVEVLLHRAGLRGERPDAQRWTLAACSIAIVASALMPQADLYQSAPWAAIVLLELAWRNGWLWWIAAEALRSTAVLLTMSLPADGVARAYAVQLLLPWLLGVGAAAAHRLMRPVYELQRELGTASERFSSLQRFARSLAARHTLIAPLSAVVDGLPAERDTLSARLDDLYRRMLESANQVDTLYPRQVSIRDSIRQTFEAVLSVPVKCERFEDILITPRAYAGAAVDAHAQRSAVLDDLAFFAEQHLLNAVEPSVWGNPRLESLVVEASQRDDGTLVLLVRTIPTSGASDARERERVLRSASGVTVHASTRSWEVTIDPHALA